MWRRHGVTEDPYDVDDIEAALAAVSGDSAFAADFFDRFVRGREAPDYEALLDQAGVALSRTDPDAAWLGDTTLRFTDEGALVLGATLLDTPLYEAGVDRGDRIVGVGGVVPTSSEALEEVLVARSPGDPVLIWYESRGDSFEVEVELAANPRLAGRWLPEEEVGADAAAFRADWR
jgi:predicted metalloprotease with PDZ domain